MSEPTRASRPASRGGRGLAIAALTMVAALALGACSGSTPSAGASASADASAPAGGGVQDLAVTGTDFAFPARPASRPA